MRKAFYPLLCACLFSACAFAQSEPTSSTTSEMGQQPQHPALIVFSSCLKSAVDSERADTVSDASLNRVKNACQSEWAAVKQAFPQGIVDKMQELLDESLLRELHR